MIREVETGKERELNVALTRIGNATRWRPDGQALLVSGKDEKNRPGVFLVDVGSGSLTPVLMQQPPGNFCAGPEWSADGADIFCQRRESSGDARTYSIVRRHIATGKEAVLFQSTGAPCGGGFLFRSPDGKWLVFRPEDCVSRRLGVVSTQGGELREIKDFPMPLSWTPDSRYVIAQRGKEVSRIPLDGGAPQKWEGSWEGLQWFLRVHPDGKRVVYRMQQPGSEIWAVENLFPKTIAAR